MKPYPLFAAVVATSLVAPPAAAQPFCGTSGGFSLNDHGEQRTARRLGPALVFTSGLRVNTDGAGNSYHPIGRDRGALNTICNGIAIRPRAGSYAGQRITAKAPESIASGTRCQMLLDAFRHSRDADYEQPPEAQIEWYALELDRRRPGKPCIQKSDQPFPGFFVAQTAIPADTNRADCNPAHWIDSNSIPYVTLPGERLRPHGVRLGDLALVHRRVGGSDRLIVAVAGDTGNQNELGEGSIALHTALGNAARRAVPADGGRPPIPANIGNGVTTFFFPGRQAPRPITAETLADQLDMLLRSIGGREAILRCTSGLR